MFSDDDEARARLREAACLLSDLGWREHPDYRSEQAFMRVLRMPVAGIDHGERVVLALAMAIRYGADLDETHYADPFMSLVKDDDVTFAWRVGAVIRLAYSLSGGTLAMLNQTRISKKDGKICLHLPEEFAPAVRRSRATPPRRRRPRVRQGRADRLRLAFVGRITDGSPHPVIPRLGLGSTSLLVASRSRPTKLVAGKGSGPSLAMTREGRQARERSTRAR